jgi:type IV secretory pathway TrbD component
VLTGHPFTPVERMIAGLIAAFLLVAGSAGVALGVLAHAWLPTLAGRGAWCLGIVYARATQLGRPL